MPCHPARARQLLSRGRATLVRRVPCVIRLSDRMATQSAVQPLAVGLDPGSKASGVALMRIDQTGAQIPLFAAELWHRGPQIHKALQQRAGYRRRRRSAHCRYRPARFLNRRRVAGWLPPSVVHRVHSLRTWVLRLARWCPVVEVHMEVNSFDTQLMQDPDISGPEYQHGTLYGFEIKEYLRSRHGGACAYCGRPKKGEKLQMEVDHLIPRRLGGSDRVSNLVWSCHECNHDLKGRLAPEAWLSDLQSYTDELNKIRARNLKNLMAGRRPSLRDAAVMNACRYRLRAELAAALPHVRVQGWSAARTAWNRQQLQVPKTHAIDACCVGERGSRVVWRHGHDALKPLKIIAVGHGSRQVIRPDRSGFPRASRAKMPIFKAHNGISYRTHDLVVATTPCGRRLSSIAIRASGSFHLRGVSRPYTLTNLSHRHCRLVQRHDGYRYELYGPVPKPGTPE